MQPERVFLLEPRGPCGGVEAAVQALAWLVLLDEPALHCFHHVVHNEDVVARFEALGVTFVDDPDDVPLGSTVMLSAHGIAPEVRRAIDARAGRVVDAICPLVAKVHREIAGRSAAGDRVLYLGRPGHDESEGAVAVAPGAVTLVGDVLDIEALAAADLGDRRPVAVLAQTTLRVEEVEAAEAAARRLFPHVWTPARGDICDASSTRQAAVRAVAAQCDVVVVVGSAGSSNTMSLVAAATEAGAPRAVRVDDASGLPDDLAGTVAVTAGASTPDRLIDAVVRWLDPGGRAETVRGPAERIQSFPVPAPVRRLVHEQLVQGALSPQVAELALTAGALAEDLLLVAEARLAGARR